MSEPRRVTLTWQTTTAAAPQLITLDASVSENHQYLATVTDHPVEKGVNIADHIRPEPIQLSIDGIITNTPVHFLADNADGASPIQKEISGRSPTIGNTLGRPVPIVGAFVSNVKLPFLNPDTAIVKAFDPEFDRVKRVHQALQVIRAKGYLLTVATSLVTYFNMALVSLSIPREAANGNSLDIKLQLKEVRFGSTEEVPAPTIPTAKANKGTKIPTEVPEPEEGAGSTATYNLFAGDD